MKKTLIILAICASLMSVGCTAQEKDNLSAQNSAEVTTTASNSSSDTTSEKDQQKPVNEMTEVYSFSAGDLQVKLLQSRDSGNDSSFYTGTFSLATDRTNIPLSTPATSEIGMKISKTDTKSHFSVFEIKDSEQWLIVFKSAEQTDKSVFATFYSVDKLGNLSAFTGDVPSVQGEISLTGTTLKIGTTSYTIDMEKHTVSKA